MGSIVRVKIISVYVVFKGTIVCKSILKRSWCVHKIEKNEDDLDFCPTMAISKGQSQVIEGQLLWLCTTLPIQAS